MKCRECRDGELETRIGEHVYVEVSQEGAKRGRLAMVAGSKDWRTEERAA